MTQSSNRSGNQLPVLIRRGGFNPRPPRRTGDTDLGEKAEAKAKENPDAERQFLQRLKVDEAAKVMGGRARLQQVLEGKDWAAVINANKDPLYQLKRVGDILSTKMATAFDTAKAGGIHYGLFKRYMNDPDHLIEKAVRSYEKRIAEHQAWITHPELKLPPDITNQELDYLVKRKWPDDIKRLEQERDVMIGILEERNRG